MSALSEVCKERGLSLVCEFIPWSKSRNAGEKNPSLNWHVTLMSGGHSIVSTNYSAGCGHAPSYKQGDRSKDGADAVLRECQTGRGPKGRPIEPKIADVVSSLMGDADVLNYGGFEDWANSLGYDTDSRKAEAIYRACIETALKLKAGLSEDTFRALQDASQEY